MRGARGKFGGDQGATGSKLAHLAAPLSSASHQFGDRRPRRINDPLELAIRPPPVMTEFHTARDLHVFGDGDTLDRVDCARHKMREEIIDPRRIKRENAELLN